MLLVSEAEFFSPKPADFLVAKEKKPGFDFGETVNFAKSKVTAPVIATNALREHKDISVIRKANIANGLFMNCVHVGDQHNGSLSVNENEITLADERLAFEFFAEPLEKLLLRGAEKIFQRSHAGTS